MAYRISEGCIECGECSAICPFGAVIKTLENSYEIISSLCSECTACVGVCPLNIIKKED